MLIREESKFTDEELIELIKGGNETAFSSLYNRYWDKLFSVAFHRLSDEMDAQEVVQEVFLSIWQRREDLEIKSSVSGYLSVSIKYQIINRLAKRRRLLSFQEKVVNKFNYYEDSTSLWMAEKELKEKLERCVNLLPEKCRIVFKMSREEGKKIKEISEELNLAEKTIEAHITRALKQLRNNFPLWIIVLFR